MPNACPRQPERPYRGESTMPTDVIMPQMGESIFEGTITNGSRRPATASKRTSRYLKFPPTRWTRRFPRPWPACSPRSRFPAGATVEVNTVVAVIGGPAVSAGCCRLRQTAGLCRNVRLRCSAVRSPQPQAPPAQLQPGRKCFAPRRWCAASPKRTTSTSARSPAPARRAASPRKMCCAT